MRPTLMRIADRIEMSGMPTEVLATFREGLAEVVAAGGFSSMEHEVLRGLFARIIDGDVEPAPFEDLWPWAELFVSACVYVAVCDGAYGVEEARIVGVMARRLGFGAGDLARIEERVFEDLWDRVGRDRKPQG
jgi:hypothetical protein